MLFELSSFSAMGPFNSYIALSPRENNKEKTVLFSREHWLMYKFSKYSFLLGRMTVPFGIKTPDHTRITRRYLKLTQFDQEYGARLLYESRKHMFAIMGYLGNYLIATEKEQKKRDFN